MEARRLIKFGRASFVISLPKKWVTAHKLKKGNLIFLDDSSDKLVVSPYLNKSDALKKISLSADKKSVEQLGSEITSAYLNNVDRIEIVGADTKEKMPKLRGLLESLPGLELIEQSDNFAVVHDFIDRGEVAIEPIFRRVDMLIRSMMKEAWKGIDVQQSDKQVNRLTFLTKRVLRCALENPSTLRSLQLNNLGLLKHWLMITQLESVGDEIKRISRLRGKQVDDDVKEVQDLFEKQYVSIMKAYHTGDSSYARNVQLSTKERSERCQALLKDKPDRVQLVYHLNALSAHLKNIAQVCINFTLIASTAKSALIEPLEKETGFLQSSV